MVSGILNLPKGTEKSLIRMREICARLGHPEIAFRTIHVAGTNGKGSVCTKIATALTSQGYRCGLYTSPHIHSFCERISIDGTLISEERLTALHSRVEREGIPLTFFEMATILAFLYFREQNVEIAVIETGLGGRWDATNVIHPLVSIITSIGFDHRELLGNTLEEIAHEKAGIIKKNTPVVIGPDTPAPLFQAVANEMGSPLSQSLFQSEDYERDNQEIARLALQIIAPTFPLSPSSIENGLKARPPCRFERYVKQKEVILDVAHNGHGFARLIQRLKTTYPTSHFRFIVGFSKEKDIPECAREIELVARAVHIVSGSHPRLASLEEVAKAFRNPIKEPSMQEAIRHALNAPFVNPEIVVIAGSFYIMSEAKSSTMH